MMKSYKKISTNVCSGNDVKVLTTDSSFSSFPSPFFKPKTPRFSHEMSLISPSPDTLQVLLSNESELYYSLEISLVYPS